MIEGGGYLEQDDALDLVKGQAAVSRATVTASCRGLRKSSSD